MAKSRDSVALAKALGSFSPYIFYHTGIVTTHNGSVVTSCIKCGPISRIQCYRFRLDENIIIREFW